MPIVPYQKPVALITGASSGIGLDLAEVFAQNRYDLIITARNQAKLEELAKKLSENFGTQCHVIISDLNRAEAPSEIKREIDQLNIKVDVLVNNAGFGALGPHAHMSIDTDLSMLQVNIIALTKLTKLFLPEMLARKSGRILNVASVGGFLPGPLMAVYYATKAYVLSYSEALAEESADSNVYVSALCPGPTLTNFQAVAGMKRFRVPKAMAIPSRKVAEMGYYGLMGNKRIIVPGWLNLLTVWMVKHLPRSWSAKAIKIATEKTLV